MRGILRRFLKKNEGTGQMWQEDLAPLQDGLGELGVRLILTIKINPWDRGTGIGKDVEEPEILKARRACMSSS